eukprot:CAMPEP_0179368078 /NCGR_PEP_ID=MMETSP0797-20121207/83914_1 /TAXON_ID=47934 /ORGANISM="Dinophysis acuminata, Strain DAEP01" /LENGTH=45 /DNA_ID= /DNA_START= /DNA_END= /DNA_ORIENTATION=
MTRASLWGRLLSTAPGAALLQASARDHLPQRHAHGQQPAVEPQVQ